MKRVLIIGSTGCGKTTLCQRLNGINVHYKKTQAMELINSTIDTPGEYLDRRTFLNALIVTATEVDVVLMVQDAVSVQFQYSPGQSGAFVPPCIGVITKIDLATPQQIQQAEELLKLAGVTRIFSLSAYTGEHMNELKEYLLC